MTTELVPRSGDAPVPWSGQQLEILKRDLGIKNDEHLAYFAQVATHKGLDPFLGEIVPVYYGSDMVIQETVEGLRTIAERSGLYDGYRGPFWCGPDLAWKEVWLSDEPPAAARYEVLRKDWKEPAAGVARWSSSVQLGRDRKPMPIWRDRPDEMLGKTAEVRALKRAFPKEFARAGISVRDMSDAQVVTVEAKRAGMDDDDRHALVAEITDGRTQSTTELTDDETLKARQEIAQRRPASSGSVSPSCSSGQHATCPGYYKMAFTCECSCHRPKPEPDPEPDDAVVRTIARAAGDLEDRLERLTPWQIEELKTWRRAMGLARPVGTLDAAERTRLAAELDRRGWALPGDDPQPPDPIEEDLGDEPF